MHEYGRSPVCWRRCVYGEKNLINHTAQTIPSSSSAYGQNSFESKTFTTKFTFKWHGARMDANMFAQRALLAKFTTTLIALVRFMARMH